MPKAPDDIDVPLALANILHQLQAQPQRDKLFGVYWWPVKLLLRHNGYTTDQLYMLGIYQDPITAGLVPRMGLQDTLRAALIEYGHNARFARPGGIVESPDGELVKLHDEDADL